MIMTAPLLDRLTALADPIRCRLLLAVEREELAVNELRAVLQLPQSTVSRHLRVLLDEGWVKSRADKTTNWYRMATRDLDIGSRRLWQVVREQVAETPGAQRDAARVKSVLAGRRIRTQEFFATDAGRWDRVRAELFGAGTERLALGGLLDPGWTVGDLGSGTGPLAALLAPLTTRVIAVDESPAMLAAARERTRHFPNVECRQGALEALPIDDETLDLAMIVLVLHHLPEPARAVEEASRALRPAGRLVLVDMMPHERSEYRDEMGHQWLGFDQETVLAWCRAAGLGRVWYRPLPPQPETKGPLLFVAAAEKLH